MDFKDRSSYDDIYSSEARSEYSNKKLNKKSRSLVVALVLIGLLISLAAILIWVLNFSSFSIDTKKEQAKDPPKVVEVEKEPTEETIVETKEVAQAISTVVTPQPTRDIAPLDFGSNWYVEHTVSSSETLESLAELYNITIETLLSVNAIKNISSIKEGSVLKIPRQNGQLYTVQLGDSLSIISNRFNPSLGWKNLQQINNLSSEVIYPGQKIFIPSVEVGDDGSFASFDRFVKPADGRITGLYGQTVVYGQSEEVVTLKGIWIEAASGTKILASASGLVVDVGSDPRNGNYIILNHDYGYKTTYAHLEGTEVKIGQQVKKGEPIATIGQSGNIGKRALYFSIEQEGIALNPANFF